MINVIEKIDFNEENNQLSLVGNIDGNTNGSTLRIALRERSSEAYGIVFKQMIEAKCKWENNKFIATIDFNQFYNCKYNTSLDLFVIDSKFNRYPFIIKDTLFKKKVELKSSLVYGIIAVSGSKNIYIDIKSKISIKIEEFNVENRKLDIKFKIYDTKNEKINILPNKMKIKLKERLTREIFSYSNELISDVISCDDEYRAQIDLEKFSINYNIYENAAYDLFLNIEDLNGEFVEHTLPTIENIKINFDIDDFYKGIIYSNYKKELSLLINTSKVKININKLMLDTNGLMNIDGHILGIGSNLKDLGYIIKIEPEMKFNQNSLVPYSVNCDITFNKNTFTTQIDLKEKLSSIWMDEETRLKFYLEITNKETKEIRKLPLGVEEYVEISDENIRITDGFLVKISENRKNLTLEIIEKNIEVKYKPIKISVLGSCLSRLAFSSTDYYNPTYKSKYKVVSTMFHTSLISLFSKPIDNAEYMAENYLQTLKPMEKKYILKDLKKEFFNDLREQKPDFLIIDFYQDAVRDFIIFEDESVLSAGINLRQSELLDVIKDKSSIITHNKSVTFLKYWDEALKKFAEEIVKYIEPQRIIINSAICVNEYIEDGSKKQYKTLSGFVKRNNYFFEYMNKAALTEIPNSKIIDLTKYNYIADSTHPEGNTPTHYQSQYYKEFLSELDSIVLKTYLNENRIEF